MNRILLYLIIIVFSGCVTIREYSENNNTLVVGQIKNIHDTRPSKDFNGVYQSNITIILKKLGDNENIVITSKNNGLFIIQDLQEGIYDLIETKFERQIGSIIYQLGGSINRYFFVSGNKVNNLGIIVQNIQERSYTLQTIDYDTVRKNFNEKYPKLQWNNIEWIDTYLTRNIPIFSISNLNMDNENWDIELLDTARENTYLTTVEKNIILELNKVRSNPKKYAELYIKPMLKYFNGYLYSEPGKDEETTHEGIISAEECYYELSKMNDVQILFPEYGLSLGAKDHIKDQGPIGITGHIGTDRSRPHDRAIRYGIGNYIGENISYGNNSAKEMIIRLIIDDGIPSRGHRNSIMNKEYNQVGVATGIHKRYGTMCVIMLARGYISK